MFKKTLPAFTLLLIVLLCAAFALSYNEGFTTNAKDLDKDISKKTKVLVLFFTMNCGYCKELSPEWEKAQDQMSDVMTSVDCTNTEEPDVKALMKKYNITRFPRMAFFNNGTIQEDYEGPRKSEDILNYVKSKTA
jgi:thiol-disulfide isomerase/thioredoxin